MFERFTDGARRVMVLAQQEARRLHHNYIGTEHILLALVHQGEGIAAKALQSLNISFEAAVQQVEEIVGRGQAPPTGHIPFTPRSKKVLELAFREGMQLGTTTSGPSTSCSDWFGRARALGPKSFRGSAQISTESVRG